MSWFSWDMTLYIFGLHFTRAMIFLASKIELYDEKNNKWIFSLKRGWLSCLVLVHIRQLRILRLFLIRWHSPFISWLSWIVLELFCHLLPPYFTTAISSALSFVLLDCGRKWAFLPDRLVMAFVIASYNVTKSVLCLCVIKYIGLIDA